MITLYRDCFGYLTTTEPISLPLSLSSSRRSVSASLHVSTSHAVTHEAPRKTAPHTAYGRFERVKGKAEQLLEVVNEALSSCSTCKRT